MRGRERGERIVSNRETETERMREFVKEMERERVHRHEKTSLEFAVSACLTLSVCVSVCLFVCLSLYLSHPYASLL